MGSYPLNDMNGSVHDDSSGSPQRILILSFPYNPTKNKYFGKEHIMKKVSSVFALLLAFALCASSCGAVAVITPPPLSSGGAPDAPDITPSDDTNGQSSIPQPSKDPTGEPADKYSADWFAWLLQNGKSKYPHAQSAKVLNGTDYARGYASSPFEIRPYDHETKSASPSSRFGLNLFIAEEDLTNHGIDPEKVAFTVFYKPKDLSQPYQSVLCTPETVEAYEENGYLYLLDLYSAGMNDLSLKESGYQNSYEMIFMVQEYGKICLWADATVLFTKSSQAYLNDAIALEVVSQKEQKNNYKGLLFPSALIELYCDIDYEKSCSFAVNAEKLDYAGASHRPLYVIKSLSELELFKEQLSHLVGPHSYESPGTHYFQDVCDAATEEFFMENDLFLIYPIPDSSSIDYDAIGAFVNGDTLLLTMSAVNNPDCTTEDVASRFIALSLPKSATEGCLEFDAIYRYYTLSD